MSTQESLIVAARSEDGQIITKPGAQVHSDLPAEWNATLGYVTADNRFLSIDEARILTTNNGSQPPPYLRAARSFESSLESVASVLEYREERRAAFNQLLQHEIGISEEQAKQLEQLVSRDRSTDTFERGLSPEQRERLERFFDGPYNSRNGPMDDWIIDSQKNPSDLLQLKERAEVAEIIVRELGNLHPAPVCEPSDRFVYPVIALLRLKELGGSWDDVSNELKKKLQRMRAGADSLELYEGYGRQIRAFADQYGIELPLERGATLDSIRKNERDVGGSGDNLLQKADEWRAAWKTGTAEERAGIADEIKAELDAHSGSGRTKIPLQVALQDYVTDRGTRALVEKRHAAHTAAINFGMQHGLNRAARRGGGLER